MSEGNLPATMKAEQPAESGNLPSTRKAPTQPKASSAASPSRSPKGRLVDQYGPVWVKHALSGGTIVDGNILID